MQKDDGNDYKCEWEKKKEKRIEQTKGIKMKKRK